MTLNFPHKVTSIFSFLIPACFLIYGNSYSWFVLPLMIFSFIFLFNTKDVALTTRDKKLFIALSLYFFCTALSLAIMGGKLSNLDAPSRSLFIIPVIMLLLKYPPQKNILKIGLLSGAILSGAIALYHYIALDIRAFTTWGFMVIQSGNFAMSLGLFSLIIALDSIKKEKGLGITVIATIACILGISASFLSGARGGWVLSPFIALAIVIIYREVFTTTAKILLIIFMFTITSLGYKSIETRISQAYNDIVVYLDQDKSNTSVGYRFEMWKAGVHAYIHNPVFGTGYEDREQSKHEAIKDGYASEGILKFSRLHNSYIEEASVKGTIGLIVLLLFFSYPLLLFYNNYIQTKSEYALLGIVHIISTMGYSLTQNFLNHQSGILYFSIFTAFFYAQLKWSENK